MLNNKNCMILTFILHIHALIFNFWKNIEFFLLGPPMVYTIWGHLAQAYTFSTFFMETLSLHSHHTPRPRQCVGMLPSMFPQKLIESVKKYFFCFCKKKMFEFFFFAILLNFFHDVIEFTFQPLIALILSITFCARHLGTSRYAWIHPGSKIEWLERVAVAMIILLIF